MGSPRQQHRALFRRATAGSRSSWLRLLLVGLPLVWSGWACTLGSGLDLPSGRDSDSEQDGGDLGNGPPGDGDSLDGEPTATGGTGGVHGTALGGAHPCGDGGAGGAGAQCNEAD